MCWHKWGKWSDPYVIGTRGVLITIQTATCVKCGETIVNKVYEGEKLK